MEEEVEGVVQGVRLDLEGQEPQVDKSLAAEKSLGNMIRVTTSIEPQKLYTQYALTWWISSCAEAMSDPF